MSFFAKFRKNEDGVSNGETEQIDASATPPPPATPPQPIVKDDKDIKMTVEDEPEEVPARVELESQVRERDEMISAIEKARQEKEVELMKMQEELEKEKLELMKEAFVHKIESERIKRQTAHAEERLKALETDMQDKAAIHEYANLIKGVAPKGGVDAQYVTKLQSQLAKAVKKMETTTEEMKELDKESTLVVNGLTREISDLVEERCRIESELRKQMEVLQEQKKDMQMEYETRIRDNLKTLQALRAKAVSQTTIDELEAELEDSETKLEELMRINEKQSATIEHLQHSLTQEEQAV
jgi:chromosome segregation ATPase